MKEFKRQYNFFINAIIRQLDATELWWDQLRCPHTFKGIGVNRKPAKICKHCDFTVELTEEEFFREFGEEKLAQLKRGY